VRNLIEQSVNRQTDVFAIPWIWLRIFKLVILFELSLLSEVERTQSRFDVTF
jgi:hypothetical protein